MGNEDRRVELSFRDELHEAGSRDGVDEPRRDCHVLDPETLEGKCHGLSVDADDGDGVARRNLAGEHADLVGGRQDVRQKENLLVAQLRRDLVRRGVGERYARVFGLNAVDQVAENPAAATRAEAVTAGPAGRAASAGGDAGGKDAVSLVETRYRLSRRDDGADGLVAEDRARGNLRH